MKSILRVLRNLVFGKSVDSILSVFQDVVNDLQAVATRHSDEIATQNEIISVAQETAADASREYSRARDAITKVRALLPA